MGHLSRMRPWDTLLSVITGAITVSSRAKCATTTTHILMLLVEAGVASAAAGVGPGARVLRDSRLGPIARQVSRRIIGS